VNGDRDKLLDAWDRTRVQLATSDANLWRARELLLEWTTLTDSPGPDVIEAIRQRDRLHLETRTFLFETPDVVQIPTTSALPGEATSPDGSSRGTGQGGTDDLAGRRHLPRSTSGEPGGDAA
jgi:hypothetical protein